MKEVIYSQNIVYSIDVICYKNEDGQLTWTAKYDPLELSVEGISDGDVRKKILALITKYIPRHSGEK